MKPIKNWRSILGIVLVAGLVPLAGVQVAAAESRGNQADVIFTKWVTAWPSLTKGIVADMKGVDSGDSGPGIFTGEVLEYSQTGSAPNTTTHIVALYHINGGAHAFTARLTVTQDDAKGAAVLNGDVTSNGWMHGAKATGAYQVIYPSGIDNSVVNGAAFQGTLHLQRDR